MPARDLGHQPLAIDRLQQRTAHAGVAEGRLAVAQVEHRRCQVAGRILDLTQAGDAGQRLGPVDRQVTGDVDVARLERVRQRRGVWVQLERQGIEARPLGPVFGRCRRRLCRCRERVGWDGRRCAAGRQAGALQDDLVIAQARESERPVADRLEAERGGAPFRDRDGGQQMGGNDGLRGRRQERGQRLFEDEADLRR